MAKRKTTVDELTDEQETIVEQICYYDDHIRSGERAIANNRGYSKVLLEEDKRAKLEHMCNLAFLLKLKERTG